MFKLMNMTETRPEMSIDSNYYLQLQKDDLFQCSICFQPQISMLQCKEACQKIFCRSCFRINDLGYYGHSQNCKPQGIASVNRQNIQLYCPSWNKQCSIPLKSQSEFEQHALNCQHVSESMKSSFKAKRMYRCLNDHQLNFPLNKQNCFICNKYHYSSRCSICSIGICTTCRIVPCTKEACPKGHPFNVVAAGSGVTCDICGISIRHLDSKKVYSDRACNFDICSYCHKKVVDKCEIKYEFSPEKPKVSDNNENSNSSDDFQ